MSFELKSSSDVSLWVKVKYVFCSFFYLHGTSAPAAVYIKFLYTLLRYPFIVKAYRSHETTFLEVIKKGAFTYNWFSANIPFWAYLFKKYHLRGKLNLLEIGSWEGMSSCFMLHALPDARLTCVDVWDSVDEYKELAASSAVEHNFDANTALYNDRIIKFKGTSFNYFNNCPTRAQFDVVYIDGSHRSDDVIIDAIKGFDQLKVGGIMIFDDYFWQGYRPWVNNPASAVNAFLTMKKGHYKLALVYWQLVIQKTAETDYRFLGPA